MMENGREYSGLIILTVLGTLLLGARAHQHKNSVRNVTLVPRYTGEIKEIIWLINTTIVVEMKLNPPKEIKFSLSRDRFSINENNGALTIINLNINDVGSYTAEAVMKNDDVHITEIKLIVHAQQQQTSLVRSDVTLVPRYTGEVKEIIWLINTTIVVEMELNPLKVFTFLPPRNRFTINENNGALSIINLNINDIGSYTAETVLKNDDVHITEITLTVFEISIPNKGIIPACVMPTAIIAVAVLFVVR